MASKIYDPFKLSLYPDHSTVCDAFHACKPDGGGVHPAYRSLKPWLERFAQEANLCLSMHHIVELARWGDEATANSVAEWYDRLPIVWAKSTQTVEQEEAEHWAKIAVGVPSEALRPFASTLQGAFHQLTPEMTVNFLARSDHVRALLDASREMGHERQEEFMGAVAQEFRDDLAWADENLPEEQREAREAYNERCHIRRLAQEANQRLTDRRDPAYARKSCTGGEVQDRLVALFNAEPRAMPSLRVQRRLWPGFRSRAHGWTQGSGNERRTCRSGLEDNLHASIGAAYCDVFTCDGLVAEWLGDLRANLRLRPQMTSRSHPDGDAGFVRDLMAV